MSYEITNGYESLGQFATSQGYADLSDLINDNAEDYPMLDQLLSQGSSRSVADCIEELARVAASASFDIADTADGLADMIEGQKLIIISSGMSGEDEGEDDDTESDLDTRAEDTTGADEEESKTVKSASSTLVVRGSNPEGMDVQALRTRTLLIRAPEALHKYWGSHLGLAKGLDNPGHLRNMLDAFSSQLRSNLVGSVKKLPPGSSKEDVIREINGISWKPLAGMIMPHLRDMAIRGGLESLDNSNAQSPDARKTLFDIATAQSKARAASIVGMKWKYTTLVPDPLAPYAINRTANKELLAIVDRAYADGLDPHAIAEMLGSARCFKPSRYDLVADAETYSIKHEGKKEGYKVSGVKMVDWIMDPRYLNRSRVECECPKLARNGPYPVDDIPDLPHPGCRCNLSPHK